MNQTTRHELEINGTHVTLIQRRRSEMSEREYCKKTRVFGAVPTLAPAESIELDKWTETPVTHQFKEEQPEEAARIMKGYSKAKRAVVRVAKAKLNDLLDVGTLGTQGVRVQSFSVYAGCSCPCSPGFVLDGVLRWNGVPVDVFIRDENGN